MADEIQPSASPDSGQTLLDQLGNPVQVATGDVPNALKQGYAQPSPEELQKFQNADKYGSNTELAKTFAEGAIGSVPLLGGAILKATSDPEARRARQESNPTMHLAGEVAGTGAALLAPELEGVAALANPIQQISKVGRATEAALSSRIVSEGAQTIAAKVLKKAGTSAVASAVEGGLFSSGGVINDLILGEPDLTAEKGISEIGMGAILAGGFGGILGGLGTAGPLVKNKFFSSEIKQGAITDTIRENAAKAGTVVPPRSAAEVAEMVANPPKGLTLEGLPQKAELANAEKFIPDSKFPVHELQYQSMNDPIARRDYKIFLEDSKDVDSANFRQYEAYQKQESKNLLGDTIEKVSPSGNSTTDVVRGGQNFIDAAHAQYSAEKAELKPLFKRFDEAALNKISYPGELVGKLEEAIPGISDHLSYDGADGAVTLEKYSRKLPLSKEAYTAAKDLIDAVNGEKLTIGEVRNIRESMRDQLNMLSSPRDQMQIGNLRKSLMDFMEDHIAAHEPDLAVRDTFRRYAINEQNREILERIMGGKIGDRTSFAKSIKPEDVLDRVFGNTESVKAAKAILGSSFSDATASYLAKTMEAVTDNTKNGFSSNKFGSFLRSKNPELATAFAEKPEVLSRIQALTKKMQILPDSPPLNPSQTATTIMQVLGGVNKFKALLDPKGELIGAALKVAGQYSAEARNKVIRDLILSGKSGEEAQALADKKFLTYGVLKNLESYAQKAASKIESGTRAVFSYTPEIAGKGGAIIASKVQSKEDVRESRKDALKQFKKQSDQIMTLTMNPDQMLKHVDDSTQALYPFAPNVSASLQKTSAAAIGFLAEKLPKPEDVKPLSAPFEPDPTQLAAFNHYYGIVSKPSSVFDMIKTGTLTSQAVEAIRTVYPSYYQAVSQSLIDKISGAKGKENPIPYRTRMTLSLFLGTDLDNSTTPVSIAMNQMAISGPSQQEGNQTGPLVSGAVKPSQKGLEGLGDLSTQSMTPMKQIATHTED